MVSCTVFRCCCGRHENQHGKLTTVQEENEELEIANDAAEESNDSDNSQPEVFETGERVKFVKSLGGGGGGGHTVYFWVEVCCWDSENCIL